MEKCDLNFILNSKTNKEFFTEQINSKTILVSVKNLLKRKIEDLLNSGWVGNSEDEKEFVDFYNKTKHLNKYFLELNKSYEENIKLYLEEKLNNESCRLVYSITLNENIFKYIPKEIFYNFKCINTIRYENKLVFGLFQINYQNNEFIIEKIEEKTLEGIIHKGIILNDSLDEMVEFLKQDELGLLKYQFSLFTDLIFDTFSYEKGFKDIFQTVDEILKTYKSNFCCENIKEIFSTKYYLSQVPYYFFMESMIKSNQVKKVHELNPYYTGKDIPKVSEIKTLSSKSTSLLKELKNYNGAIIDAVIELESYPKIGIDGTNLILSTLCKLVKVNENRDYNDKIYFLDSWFRLENLSSEIINIFDNFDITVKVFLDRCVKEMFYNNISFSSYVCYIKDYIEMSQLLKLPIPEKMPKDIIKRHDTLIHHLSSIDNENLESNFKIISDKNSKLTNKQPINNSFTIVSPKTMNDLMTEGLYLNHCVGSYVQSYVNEVSKIFFVRKQDCPEIPFVTFELDKNNDLIQIKGFSNKHPSNEIIKFVTDWIDILKEGK